MTKERRSSIRTLRGWAISVLQEMGAIHECEEHGWMQDRADPHAGDRALPAALLPFSRRGCRRNPQRLDSISASCPECPTSDDRERVVR
jgi:hypothetical protein